MIRTCLKQCLLLAMSFALVLTTTGIEIGAQQPSDEGSTGAGDSVPQSPEQLQALVAPIALYPDQLVAQILGASTFPDQVAVANYWLEQHKSLTGSALMQEVNTQSWDPSVKALTQFPTVLNNMANNLSWTSSLGEAYHNQQSEVMAAVQTLRAKAKAAGNLNSGSQIKVVQQSPQTIVIEPTNPQVVYVPEYNPAVIYGTPYVTPGYTAGDVAAAGIIGFGAGIAVGALMSGGGGCCGWGWGAWGCNWHGGAVVYNHNNFFGNPAWHGGYYNGGYHPYNNAFNRNGNNFRNSGNTFNRNVNRNTANFNRTSAQGRDRFSGSNSWAHNNLGNRSTAFSGLGDHSGGSFGDRGGCRPTLLFCVPGSMVIGPTPAIGVRSSKQLLPTTFPSCSATMQKNDGCENIVESTWMAISGSGKSGGKLCLFASVAKASKPIRPHTSVSSGVARRMTSAWFSSIRGSGCAAMTMTSKTQDVILGM